jgi:hypothetical protein
MNGLGGNIPRDLYVVVQHEYKLVIIFILGIILDLEVSDSGLNQCFISGSGKL